MYFGNNLYTTLASGITDIATSMTVATGDGADFGTELSRLWGSEKFSYYLTIFNKDYASPTLDTSREIVEVTARSTDTFTIARGKRGTSASAHSTDDKVILGNYADDLAYTIGARAHLSAVQAVASGSTTKINLNTESYDVGDCFNTTTYRFTAPVAGYYVINGSAYIESLADGKYHSCRAYKNGSLALLDVSRSGSVGHMSSSVSGILYLAKNDYIELYVEHDHGSNRNIMTGVATYLEVFLLNRA